MEEAALRFTPGTSGDHRSNHNNNNSSTTTNPNRSARVPRYFAGYEATNRLQLDGLGLGEVDRSVLRKMDFNVCTLAENMPQLHKGQVIEKPSYCVLSYTWSHDQAPHFYLDLEVVRQRILDDAYVKQAFMGSRGLFLHVWKHRDLLKSMQEAAGPPLASAAATPAASSSSSSPSAPSASSSPPSASFAPAGRQHASPQRPPPPSSSPPSSPLPPPPLPSYQPATPGAQEGGNDADERPRKRQRNGSFIV